MTIAMDSIHQTMKGKLMASPTVLELVILVAQVVIAYSVFRLSKKQHVTEMRTQREDCFT